MSVAKLEKCLQISGHNCDLDYIKTEDIFYKFIQSGYCVQWRRKFRKLFIVSETNPESRTFLKSTAEIYEEQVRHLSSSNCIMIHPFSVFRIYWDPIMIIVYLLLLAIFIPLDLAFLIHTPVFIMYAKLGLDLLCYVNMVVNFFTGYIDRANQKIELRRRKVIKRYLFGNYWVTGLFMPDFISSLPITLCMYVTQNYDFYPWKGILVFKLFLIPTFTRYVNSYFFRLNFWSSALKPFELSIWFFVAVFWFTGVTIYLLTSALKKYQTLSFTSILYFIIEEGTRIVECIMLVGPDPMSVDSPWQEKLLPIIYVIIGSCLNMVILALILQIYKSRNSARNKHQKMLQQIEQYTAYRQIAPDLKDKVLRHVDFQFHKGILKEAEILGTLSAILREEVMLHNSQNLIQRVDFFKDMPPTLLMKIVTRLRPDIYLKNEVIYNFGATGNSMYFIYVGAVTIYSEMGKEIMTFGEGKNFGELSLLNNTPRINSAVAKSDCELLRLNRKDLTEVLEPFPKITAKLRAMGRERAGKLAAVIKRMSGQYSTVDESDDVNV